MKLPRKSPLVSNGESRFEGKQKPMDINIFCQESGSRKSVTNSKVPFSISGSLSLDGWYIYSYNKPVGKNSDLSPNILYLDTPPLKGLKTYLSSYHFPSVGPKAVDKLYDTFGMDIISYLQKGKLPKNVQSVVSERVVASLEKGWQSSKEYAVSYIFLDEIGLKTSQKRYVREQFGSTFITRLNKFPFETLIKIPRLAFSDMAAILDRVNIEVSKEQIILAASSFRLLQSERNFGNTCAPASALISGVSNLTNFSNEEVSKVFNDNPTRFDRFDIGSSKFMQSRHSKQRDDKIKSELQRLRDEFQRVGSNKKFVRSELKTWNEVELSDEQLFAVNVSVNQPISVITGGPGAGKTTMVLGLVSALEALEQSVKICAPTGRAAKRIEDNPILEKFSPSTIHRYLAMQQGPDKEDFDVMIVDEASMIDIDLLVLLLESIPDGASLVFIGDPDQLPPVGPGQVFRDIIDSGAVAVSRLTGNFRQAEFSDIIKAARGVIQGRLLDYEGALEASDFVFLETPPNEVADKIISNFFEDLPSKLPLHQQSEFQILSPMRNHEAGITNLNSVIQSKLSDGKKPIFEKVGRGFEKRFFAGDRVIMTQNNYDIQVMNGDVGEISRKQANGYIVEFDGLEIPFSEVEIQSLELAYAISIHKSQGSEYPAVIIPITSEHSFMLSRNLIYTAITRGRQQVIMVGQIDCLEKAVARVMKDKRYTGLKKVLEI
ncbi:ATP-dependent RecD-like DNA helicase [Rhodobacteraceae bacterium]|nr:ATP-dependent RecD-like DNA helicase [Paracoccaceae bacterium]